MKILHLLLDIFFETIPVLKLLMEQKTTESQTSSLRLDSDPTVVPESNCENEESRETTLKLLSLLQQRLQFTLLNVVKVHSSKSKKGYLLFKYLTAVNFFSYFSCLLSSLTVSGVILCCRFTRKCTVSLC